MECMPCGNSSFVLVPEAVVLSVLCTSVAVQLNKLFLPETKWHEKLVSKVIIKVVKSYHFV
jgi:sulfur carrier protein ThiS